jgi:hypothetical protein
VSVHNKVNPEICGFCLQLLAKTQINKLQAFMQMLGLFSSSKLLLHASHAALTNIKESQLNTLCYKCHQIIFSNYGIQNQFIPSIHTNSPIIP